MRPDHFLLLLACALPAAAQTAGAGSVIRFDPALDKLVPPGAAVEKVLGNLQFAEGPVWVRTGGYLLFSDLPANAIMKWAPAAGLSVYRKSVFTNEFPKGIQIGTNGLTFDRQGRVIACEHGNRRISRTEKNGTITTLADRYQGQRLNSPNDVVLRRNGDIYFTDPNSVARNNPPDPNHYFQAELGFNGVYRITAAGKLELLTKDVPYPNGIAFSPDEKKLYVANTRPDKFWMVYDVQADGTIANGKKFLNLTQDPADGLPDGMKMDRLGNLYATGPGGVLVLSPEGKHLGTIPVPEIAANCAWGDADGKTLYITARSGLYRIKLNVPGIRP
ncbi:MAG: SMP-30/gluconolactonase/LRE family protein [Acidobacteriota bacterium]